MVELADQGALQVPVVVGTLYLQDTEERQKILSTDKMLRLKKDLNLTAGDENDSIWNRNIYSIELMTD